VDAAFFLFDLGGLLLVDGQGGGIGLREILFDLVEDVALVEEVHFWAVLCYLYEEPCLNREFEHNYIGFTSSEKRRGSELIGRDGIEKLRSRDD
jgi:hypothetical protein